ncbi:sensor histidine kinase [Flavobacterium magnum]|uniref:histidine kinase n=1 Tax=Flavobacterium magnum TaxID=2162713 RepID=A0A2S0RCP1_9FLAO|nr:HAMP domain-containing sensor histidine kinase [Flavobacterium magnum]AWA29513.1 sensor histidine kinase [Flavobacterium magnum]
MKLRSQISIFNVITRLLLIAILVFALPMLIEHVVYKHIDKTLLEKKQKFIHNLGQAEINEFLNESIKSDTYASFSVLHDEFILLSKVGDKPQQLTSVYIDEPRIIEGQQDDYRILQYAFNYEGNAYALEIGSSIAEITELTFMIRIFTLVLLLVIVLVTFLMDALFIDYLLKPFYKIIDTKIRRVNDPESFNFTDIPSHSTDFRELDEVLNQMMRRIDNHFKQEKQFIANVSHELLTPISLLKNRFENLLQHPQLDDAVADKIVASLRTLDMLRKIINNLLLISKIENNQFRETEAVSLKNLVRNVMEEMEDRIAEKSLELTIDFPDDVVFEGNRTLLYILFHNIISNAVKYNATRGLLLISTRETAGSFEISITDSGQGIPDSEVVTIFDRFTRIDQLQEGQGLGLAIASSIARFHRVIISVDSKVGRGSTFTLQFPKV